MLQLVLAAPRSGSGKTTAACALLAALQARGEYPCAFKSGPDYIDPMFHRAVLGVESHNLDLFLSTPVTVRRLYAQNAAGHGAAVVEGAMGYYDGLGGISATASAWHLADTLGENDRIVTSGTPDGELMQVLRAYTVPVTADGQTQEIITTGATTRDLLTQAGLTYTEEDYLTPAADETVPEGGSVTLQRVSYVEYTEDETVPSEVEEIPTSLYYRKQDKVQVVQQGTDGLDTVTYRETWVDGQQVDTEEIGRETQIGMIPTIQKVYGEQASVSSFVGPEVEDGVPVEGVAAVYTSQRATAYSASGTAKGASGRRLTYGTVAINPSIIPYGSLMYITSDDGKFVYGYAYAADTGTAMMTGHAFIDLYYETYDESVDNAVIPVTVYVLDDETAAKYKEQNDAILEADTTVGR